MGELSLTLVFADALFVCVLLLAVATLVILAAQGPRGLTSFAEEPSHRLMFRDRVLVSRRIVRVALPAMPVLAAALMIAAVVE